MEVEPRYLEENKIFRDWIKIFHQLTKEENGEKDRIFKTVNTVKIDNIVNNNITADEVPIPNQITEMMNNILEVYVKHGEVWKFFRGSTQPLLNGLEETNHITDECYIFRQLLCLGHACNLIIRENVKT